MDESVTKKARRRAAAQRRRSHNVLLAGLFLLLVLLVFLINLCTKAKTFSETENRNLSQMPTFSMSSLLDGSYFSGLTDYYSDQFFARDGWISLKLQEESLLGRKESGGIYLCSDDYLVAEPDTPDTAALSDTLTAVNLFAENHPDLSMQMMLVPAAASILTDKLPKNAPVRDQLSDIVEAQSQLSSSIEVLDVTSTLQAHAQEDIYYRTDHHWTSLGAYYAFQAVSGSLGLENVVDSYDIYTVTDTFEGTLASKSGSHQVSDSIQVYAPLGTDVSYYVVYPDSTDKVCSIFQSDCLEVKDKYTVFFGGNHSLVEIETTAGNDRSLLVFKDSYANSFMQFLTPYYETIIMVDPRYYYDDIETVLTTYGITDVLYLYSADTFLTDTSLAAVLGTSAS
jgi:hypothetical protein